MIVIPERFAIQALDVGGTTGVARGVFEARETTRATILAAAECGDVEAWEEVGSPYEQARTLVEDFLEWAAEQHLGLRGTPPIPVQAVVLVLESFELRDARANLAPVEVGAGIKTLLALPVGVHDAGGWRWPWEEQTPADAKRWDAARLKSAGVYRLGRGSDHKRDALRHLCTRVMRMLDEGVSLSSESVGKG